MLIRAGSAPLFGNGTASPRRASARTADITLLTRSDGGSTRSRAISSVAARSTSRLSRTAAQCGHRRVCSSAVSIASQTCSTSRPHGRA
ncbi:hypothetical protein [Lentzea guizhouensis]|uniref:hypothetical protein n=1 Tax=Lentzea guizhouensis TaxID=1586287 RepID=UPI0026802709